MEDAAKTVSRMSPSEIGHTALDAIGMVPVVGTAANLANAAWYAAQGDWKDAAWSAAAAIPIEGEAVDAGKLGKDAVDIVEDVAKAGRAVKDGEDVASMAANAAEDASKADKAAAAEEVARSPAPTAADQFKWTRGEFDSLAADPARMAETSAPNRFRSAPLASTRRRPARCRARSSAIRPARRSSLTPPAPNRT